MVSLPTKQQCINECAQELRTDYPFLSEGDSILFIEEMYRFWNEYLFKDF
jgi:hypothetical protein